MKLRHYGNYFDAFMIIINIWCAIIISGGKTWPAGCSSKDTPAAFLFFSKYRPYRSLTVRKAAYDYLTHSHTSLLNGYSKNLKNGESRHLRLLLLIPILIGL